MKRMLWSMWIATFLCSSAITQEQTRPRVLGVAHMALYVSDLQAARVFYKDFLGFAEPFVLKRDDGSDRIAFIKINDKQYISLIHISEPTRLLSISYAVFCLKKK